MKIKFEINGKALLGLSLLSAGIAFGDFVSLVDVKSSGGVVIGGMTEKDKEDLLLESMPIGSVTFRMDTVNPNVIYGGTWELITGDASVRLGDGTLQSSSLQGITNKPTVPLKKHAHMASQGSHKHTRGTMDIYGQVTAPGYGNTSIGYSLSGNGAFANYGALTQLDKIDGGNNQGSIYRAVDFRASRNWTGHTSSEAPSITVNEFGDNDDTLDTRGKYITLNVWKRIE